MKKIILIRHSDAETGSFDSTDFSRRLTTKGKAKANIQTNKLIAKNLNIDLIITSTAIRALETTQIIASIVNPNSPIHEAPFLYDDFTTSDFFNLISTIDNSYETVIIVGHNPNISLMASRLDINARISFAPCSIGVFMLGNGWSSIKVGCGKMVEFIA